MILYVCVSWVDWIPDSMHRTCVLLHGSKSQVQSGVQSVRNEETTEGEFLCPSFLRLSSSRAQMPAREVKSIVNALPSVYKLVVFGGVRTEPPREMQRRTVQNGNATQHKKRQGQRISRWQMEKAERKQKTWKDQLWLWLILLFSRNSYMWMWKNCRHQWRAGRKWLTEDWPTICTVLCCR